MTAHVEPDRRRIGILTTDTDLVVRSWDEALAEMTGIDATRAVGQRLDELVPDLRERSMVEFLREPLVSGSPVVLAPALHKYLIRCPPLDVSQEFDCMQQRVVIGALRNDEAAVGVVVTIEDVTVRLERERRFARRFRDADPAERLAAVKRLEAGAPTDVRDLTGAIADEDWRVRRAAVKALARTRDAALLDAVVSALRDGHRNFSLLSSALELLTLTGVDLTEALIALLQDPDSDLRIQAALALGTQRTARAEAALLRAFDDPDPNVQFHAIEAIGKLAPTSAIDRLTTIVESRDFFLAFPAIEALAQINDPIVAPSLTPLLSDRTLAGTAADALGRIGDESVIDSLVSALEDTVAPIAPVVSAIAAIHRRSETALGDAAEIEDRVRRAASPEAARRILGAMAQASAGPLRDLVVVVGWLRDSSVPAALARLLGSADVHHEVIEALVRFGAPAVDLLIAQLEHGDADTQGAAATALGRIGDRRAVPALVAVLGEDTRDAWLSAIGALAAIGDGRAFLPLLAFIGDADAGVRQAAIGALNSIGHPDMERHVAALLDSADARTRESAVKIAGYFGYATCAEQFLARCRDGHEAVRCAALEHLPYLDQPRTLDVLAVALADDSPRGRAAAARALGAVPEPRAGALLRQALGDEDAWVRYFAAMSLGRLGDGSSAPSLVHAAAVDPANHVRVAAIEALGALGGDEALRALEPLATDADQDVGHAAMRVLGRLRWPGAGHVLTDALRSNDARRRLVAIEALTAWGDEAVVEPLRWTAAADTDQAVAAAALAGLVAVANRAIPASHAAVGALIELTNDPDHREGAVAALARLTPTMIPWLSDGLGAEAPRARVSVVDALARMLHPAATACLQRALDDGDESVRRQAIAGLSRIGIRGLAQRLSALAQRDPSPLVRQAATAALRRDGRAGDAPSGGA